MNIILRQTAQCYNVSMSQRYNVTMLQCYNEAINGLPDCTGEEKKASQINDTAAT